MQRLARIPLQQENQAAVALLSHYDELMQIIVRYLPPSTATLFARPEVQSDGKIIEWYSELEGQADLFHANQVEPQQRDSILTRISQRLTAIEQLNADLLKKGLISPTQSERLRLLVEGASHDTKQIYVINNEPVITGWGMGQKVMPPVSPAVTPSNPASRSRWLWPFLLLLLLLGLLLWWWLTTKQPAKTPEVVSPPPVVTQPNVPEPVDVVKPNEPKVEETKPLQVVPEPPKPEPVVPEKVDDTPKVTETTPTPPEKVCSISTKPGENPQMVIIFDNSRSMLYSLLENKQNIADFERRWIHYLATPEETAYIRRSPNRLEVAKRSSAGIINSIAKTVDIGLVELRGCPTAHNHGYYSPTKRKQLRGKINAMQPAPDSDESSGGTPLYSGLKQAAAMVDGKKRDGFILLISDGEDSCETGDVCALAQQIAKRQPRLKINVVDIGGAKAANCVAKATKGKVFTANSQKQLANMINQAVKPITEVEVCK
ncbi:hypothetical protein ACNO7L_03260 [Bisgaard Taxon 45]